MEKKNKQGRNCCKNYEGRYVPVHLQVPLLIEVGFRCPFSDCSDVDKTKLQFHHIERFAKSQTHDLNRMIAVCPSCHYSLDREEISPTEAKELKIRLSRSYSGLDSLFSEDNPTLFTRLNFEGKFLELVRIITSVINYLDANHVYLPFLPELAIEGAKSHRQINSSKQALMFIRKFEERWNRKISKSHRYSLDLARGYALFDSLEFDPALKYLENYEKVFQEQGIQPIGSEADLFEVYQRLTVIYWNRKQLDADLDRLSQLSNARNDKVDMLLTEGVVKKDTVSSIWIDEVEQILAEVNQPRSSFSLGYERHTLAELFYIAAKIFISRGKKASADQSVRFYKDYFNLRGASQKIKVWDI